MIVRRCFVAIAALRDAAAKSALHGSHPRKEVGRAGRPEEGTFSGPTRILGVLYRESFFAGEGMILEVEQDQSPYDTGHRAISPCLRFCLKTCCYESAAAIETVAFFV